MYLCDINSCLHHQAHLVYIIHVFVLLPFQSDDLQLYLRIQHGAVAVSVHLEL